uniref:Long-chain-fatty-acid--CoA ligase n=1 Tax=uncultured bacterium A1Q1_fos_2286 TaxID=1256566 RepID=L7VYC2_9BACT|nr:long-chain-fatty-acid--CoA ligase [uncultured bacterium A1Q1_fos_2286]
MGEHLTYNLADQWEAVSDRVGEREALVCGDRRLTYAQLEERANRLANHLDANGIGPGDFVGCYLTNGTEYIETLLACFKLRAVPVNINYRYVAEELRYLLADSGCVVLVCDADFVERVATVASSVPALRHTLVVGAAGVDLSDTGVPDPADYETALAQASDVRPVVAGRGDDDLYVLYTGGTTGMPKGVVWQMGDAFFGCIGGGDPLRLSGPVSSPAENLERIIEFDFVFFALAPLMHAAAQWVSLMWLLCGAKVVLHSGPFDAVAIWETVAREKVAVMTVVGDAMARPLVDAWDSDGPFDISTMYSLSNGGAPLAPSLRDRLREIAPNAMLADGFGSSETGIQGSRRLSPGEEAGDVTKFDKVEPGTVVIDESGQLVTPGSGKVGRIAHSGHIPLRYHNAPEKTAETFIEMAGTRYVLPGDMATVAEDGAVILLGRGSLSINTGGEKVYPEEVEGVLKAHPAVYDVLVVGVSDERWGERVAAVVQPTPGATVTLEELDAHCRGKLAGYKIPRELVVVDEVVRSPSGKADYRWAKATAVEAVTA